MEERKLLEVIRKLLASQDAKPEELLPVDLLLIIRLLLQHADEQPVRLSQGTLALELGCTENTIREAGNRLEVAGWATGQLKRRQCLRVLHCRMPRADAIRTHRRRHAKCQNFLVSWKLDNLFDNSTPKVTRCCVEIM
jgi:hypothetical protein